MTGEINQEQNSMQSMKGLTIQSAARAVHGRLCAYTADRGWHETDDVDDREIAAVVTDSRKAGEGCLFAAIRGQRADGHRFIPQCAAAGAAVILAEDLPEDGLDIPVILTEDTLRALRDLAEYYLAVLQIPAVGIIGSVGKTSTKEVTAAVLAQQFRVLKTEGNFNNELGVPLTIFRLREDDEMAVLEMGINHFGEMSRLAKIVRPRAVIMTNIGFSHIEYLGSQEGILRAKSEVFEYMAEDGCAILNADDPLLASLAEKKDLHTVFYGIGPAAAGEPGRQIWADGLEPLGLKGTCCVIHTPDGAFAVTVPAPGKHMVSNALAAAAAGWVFGLSGEQIAEGISQMKTLAGRFHLIETGTLTIIDDSYNASPASMEAALDLLREAPGRKIAVLGDMGELGEEAAPLHARVGTFAAKEGRCDVLCCVGKACRNMAEAAAAQDPALCVKWFPDRDQMMEQAGELLRRGDTVLVKASHFMQFEKVVEALEGISL